MSKVAIVGFGYVGKAMYHFFKDHNDITIYDPYAKGFKEAGDAEVEINGVIIDTRKVNVLVPCYIKNTVNAVKYLDKEIEEVNKCDVAVICVPTPRGEDGSCDTSIVEDVLSKLNNDLIILKSTVEVGTTDKLIEKYKKNIIFCPEFAGESTYWSPYKFHTEVIETPHFIFGGDKNLTSKAIDIYMKIGGPTKKYMQTDTRTAEMVKYIENCFYATKVTFCYEVANICKEMGIDYNEARELWLLDPRINPMHTAVFKDNEKPFGGKCLLPYAKVEIIENNKVNFITLEDLYNKYHDIVENLNIMVRGTDHTCRNIEYKKILKITRQEIDEPIMAIEYEDSDSEFHYSEFRCTKEHLLPVKRKDEKLLIKSENIEFDDKLYMNVNHRYISTERVVHVYDEVYKGYVYNLELESNSKEHDDLYFIEDSTGIVTHNCFPKDLSALVSLSDKIGYDASLLREVLNSNERIAEYRKKNNESNGSNN
jgi:nucleotide sugar dehydrogenase